MAVLVNEGQGIYVNQSFVENPQVLSQIEEQVEKSNKTKEDKLRNLKSYKDMTSSKGDDGVLDLLPLMNKNILKYTDPKYHKSRPVIPGQWPNKTIDDGTDDDTVMNLHQRN